MSRKPYDQQYGPTAEEEGLEREWLEEQRCLDRLVDGLRPGRADETYGPRSRRVAGPVGCVTPLNKCTRCGNRKPCRGWPGPGGRVLRCHDCDEDTLPPAAVERLWRNRASVVVDLRYWLGHD
jgi:hypothetical protein